MSRRLACGAEARRTAETIAQAHGLRFADLTGRDTTRKVTRARREAMQTLHATGKYPAAEIGRFFGRDHSTVLFALGRKRRKETS